MQKHTKIYFDYFHYGIDSFVPCECCGCRSVDIHHIENRKKGGSKDKDYIENLMGMCRFHHEKYGDKKQYIDFLKEIHLNFMEKWGRDITE